jgi:uncharacterized damage-inducible protein DinB
VKTRSAKSKALTSVLASSVDNSLEKTAHLVSLIDPSHLSHKPSVPEGCAPVVSLGHLLGHLLDCMAGFCAAFYAAFPAKLDSLQTLREDPVNHFCKPSEALERIRVYRMEIARGFRVCSDVDLKRKLKTVFQPHGARLAAILLGNLEHLLNHKYQLFFYLRILGAPVGTKDLYYLPEAKRSFRKRPN